MNPIAYLRFWWHSKNEHAVHSPFVFDLVTKCFYDKKEYKAYDELSQLPIKGFSYKDKALLYRVFRYFDYQNVAVFEEKNEILEFYIRLFSIIKEKKQVDMLLIDQIQLVSVANATSRMHNDSVLILCKPYQTKEKEIFWKEIVKENAFSVTIDTFHFGFAFVRKEQRKEHFVIRL